MVYQALYREWRPQTFGDVVGQNHVSQTLRNALARDQIAHAYLFSGPRGTGKTTIARLLAKAVNCTDQATAAEPCNQCRICQSITMGSSVDVQEIDAASNRGIDEIRELRDKVRYYPVECRYKVYIIDEVHMLTEPAFNALLKTLEDPPQHVIFILATTEPHKLPETIISRCQRFDFHRLSLDMIMQRLESVASQKDVTLTHRACRAIARAADGGMRDALSLLDQCMALEDEGIDVAQVEELLGKAGEDVYDDICHCLARHDVVGLMGMVEELVLRGKDMRLLAVDMCDYCRDLLLVKMGDASSHRSDPQRQERLAKTTGFFSTDYLLDLIKAMVDTESEIRRTGHGRLLMEMTLIKSLPQDRVGPVDKTLEALRETGRQPAKPTAAEAPAAPVSPEGQRPEDLETAGPEPEPERIADNTSTDCSDQWQSLLDKLRKAKKAPIAAWLQPAEPVWNEAEGVLVIAYPEQYAIHKGKIETDPECAQILEDMLAEVFGRPTRFRSCFQGDTDSAGDGAVAVSSDAKPEAVDPESDPLVKLALELFDGEIVNGDS